MNPAARFAIAGSLAVSLSGCYVTMHGSQSAGGGAATTTVATQVRGSAGFSGGRVAIRSGQVPPAGAPGGHVALGKGASLVLISGLVIADLFHFLAGEAAPTPLAADEKILETCSCYRKEETRDR